MSNDIGLRIESEQAATEEARMARVMANQPVQRVTHKGTVDATPQQVGIPFSAIIEEIEILNKINELRKMPYYYSGRIKEIGKFKEGDRTIQLTDAGERRWHEGKPAFENAIAFLATAQAAPALQLSPELSKSADDLIKKIGPAGTDEDPDDDPITRFRRYGAFSGSIIELLVFAVHNAEDVVIKCCVCDGDSSRSDRDELLGSQYHYVGIACGPHKEMGTCVSIILTERFESMTSAVDPSKPVDPNAKVDTDVDYNANKPQVDFKEVSPGLYTLTIIGAGNAPPNVSVAKKDDKIILKRFHNGKEIATANYGIPVPFELAETTATYSQGSIVVTIKPIADETKSSSIAGTVVVPAKENSSSERLGISTAQGDSVITISIEPSKYETSVEVKLEQGEAGRTTILLAQTFAMEDSDGPCKCTATSTFRLPFTTNKDSIEITPTMVTVKQAPAPEATAAAAAPKAEKGPTEGVIPITVQ